MTQPSALYRLIEERLGRPLADLVAERKGTHTWPEIAQVIADETGVVVNDETLRLWFRDRITIEVKVA